MEVQEAIPRTSRITAEHARYSKVRKLLPLDLHGVFIAEMITNLDDEDTEYFIEKVNSVFKAGMSEGMIQLVCGRKAHQFLLWLVHYVVHYGDTCKYCDFIADIYNILDNFLSDPELFKNKEVNVS